MYVLDGLALTSYLFFQGHLSLFQDATAGSLASVSMYLASGNQNVTIPIRYKMTAGTTSSTTFKLRVVGNNAGTTSINGNAGASIFGGVQISSLSITEYTS